jgi:glycosyltransferase involved in cell wall biosynthesis
MPKLSIIVPFYKAEKYVKQCIDSILNQSFKDFELIVINDASPDNTLSILKEYQTIDKRIKIINHQNNLGVSGARNSGLKIVTGDYITFIDQDDWIHENMYENMVNSALINNADIVECNYEENGFSVLKNMPDKLTSYKLDINDYIILLYKNCISLALWNKIYKFKSIKNNNIFFMDHEKVEAEDLLFNLEVFGESKVINIINKNYYHHTRHPESLSFHRVENYLQKTENLINGYLLTIKNSGNYIKILNTFSLLIIIKIRGILFQSLIKNKKHINSAIKELTLASNNKTIKMAAFNGIFNKNTKFIDRIIALLFYLKSYLVLLAFYWVLQYLKWK